MKISTEEETKASGAAYGGFKNALAEALVPENQVTPPLFLFILKQFDRHIVDAYYRII
ncbi:MAG: hypothetical protein ACI9VM_000458 [Candidatus Azotimanducaceae bacterium]